MPRDARLHPHWSLRWNSHFCFEVAVETGLDGAQRFLSSFKAVEHAPSSEEMMRVATFFASTLGGKTGIV